ncbi:MAG: argininosuccinate lyase [Chitinivibrionales bacterium]|nr:argininosuccinate lyase [Chitinivibrionales bacterium]
MKMWDGRFAKTTDRLMELFNNSLPFDRLLIREDIEVNRAWAEALRACGVLSATELKKIVSALNAIERDCKKGSVRFEPGDEDIHMAIERMVIEKAGPAGAKIHTGRSRNDQVATDLRLYAKKSLQDIIDEIIVLQKVVLARAESDVDVVMPGYTHLQQAQPVIMAHYWLSLFYALEREKSRCIHAANTADILPLGSGALAGSGFVIDRALLAKKLGFAAVSDNSMDAVATRDFVLEALSVCSAIGILLSRYAEDLIIWSSKEFGYVELDDAWSTGSSMMPQKKNPDSLELLRGKTGRLIGNYTSLAATLKGTGLTYYKDLQEDKEPLFDSVSQTAMMLLVFSRVLSTIIINKDRTVKNLDPLLLATDIADYLTTKGVPFRDAHHITGDLVSHCIRKKVNISEISLEKLKMFSSRFDKDIKRKLTWNSALAGRDIAGGTGKNSVKRQIRKAKKLLGAAKP